MPQTAVKQAAVKQAAVKAQQAPDYRLTAKFDVVCTADPNVTARVLELFALRGLVPLKITSSRFASGQIVTALWVDEVSETVAGVLAQKIRALVQVHDVGLEFHFKPAD